MRLKPVRFIGHKIGPFEHIELNWDKDSRYTLIVGENGMGKTTLVAAMAACLSFGYDFLFPITHFQRFTHEEQSFAYLEVEIENEIGWILRWPWLPKGIEKFLPDDADTEITNIPVIVPEFDYPTSQIGLKPIVLPGLSILEEGILIRTTDQLSLFDNDPILGTINTQVVCSRNLLSIAKSWRLRQNIKTIAAAYGVNRDFQQRDFQRTRITDRRSDAHSLENILNPFIPIRSSEIFQVDAYQRSYEAYKENLRRVTTLFNEQLEYPISFEWNSTGPFELNYNGTLLSINQLSDGSRNLLSWLLDYLIRTSRLNWENPAHNIVAPGLIIVDEIDSHLHPEWQRKIMAAISEVLPETYIVATTHSPFILGATDEAQVFQIYKEESGQLAVKASFDELYGYPADLVLTKAFVPSLYAPEVEQKLARLSELAGLVATNSISPAEKQEHDQLLQELAEKNPWLNNLLALFQTR